MSKAEFVPESEKFLSTDVLNDPDIELVFIQHSCDITTEQAKEAYAKYLKNSTTSNIKITPLPTQTPVYPVSFGDGGLQVSKNVDEFIILTPATPSSTA